MGYYKAGFPKDNWNLILQRNSGNDPKYYFFLEIIKIIVNLYCGKAQVPTIAKIILTKKDKVGGITLTNAKAYGTAKVIKSVWYSWRDRDIDQ